MNIFTEMISDILGVTKDVALRVQNHIDNWFDLDWSEATKDEISYTAWAAYEDLNQNVPAIF